MSDLMKITKDFGDQREEQGKEWLYLDLMLEALRQNKLDVYDFIVNHRGETKDHE